MIFVVCLLLLFLPRLRTRQIEPDLFHKIFTKNYYIEHRYTMIKFSHKNIPTEIFVIDTKHYQIDFDVSQTNHAVCIVCFLRRFCVSFLLYFFFFFFWSFSQFTLDRANDCVRHNNYRFDALSRNLSMLRRKFNLHGFNFAEIPSTNTARSHCTYCTYCLLYKWIPDREFSN